MKKLMMIAAAMTIVGGAYAACGDEQTDEDCALVYDFKASLKTTEGKAYSGDCDDVCYRKKGSLRLKGYLFGCDCTCEDFLALELYVYDKKTDMEESGAPEWTILNAIGKKGTDLEALMSLELGEAVFTAAGFGSFDKYGLVKKISGYVVGTVPYPECSVDCSDGNPAVAYPACDFIEDPYVDSIAYGSWSIRYNSSKTKKYAANTWSPYDVWY